MRRLGLKVMVEPVTFAEWVDLDLFGMRVITWGGELLSGLGLLLAMVGLAGAVSYSVGLRKTELRAQVPAPMLRCRGNGRDTANRMERNQRYNTKP